MIQSFKNIWSIPDLRKRVLYTFGLLAVYRIGGHIPTPGIDNQALIRLFERSAGSILGYVDLFAGGNFKRFTIFALGIMPYITASIILQLLTVVWPYLEKLSKEGEAGRRKITQWTRYGTVALSVIQSYGIALLAPVGELRRERADRPESRVRIPDDDDAHPDHGHRASSCGWASRSRSAASATAFR